MIIFLYVLCVVEKFPRPNVCMCELVSSLWQYELHTVNSPPSRWLPRLQVQHALMLASAMLDLAQPDVAGLCKAAADHERHDALFGPLHA